MNKTCIVICGPTASGKTGLSLKLAEYFKTSILSFDSRQCYRELNIGVAKPTLPELEQVHHFFINSHSIHENVTAATFEEYGLKALIEIFTNNDIAVLVGGTGLYLKALLEGLDDIPPTSPEIRTEVIKLFEKGGIEALQAAIKESDPVFYATGDTRNPRRLMRALEVFLESGKPFSEFAQGNKKSRPFRSLLLAPDIARESLYSRINNRVDQMVSAGIKNEAAALLPFKHLPALQTVGYNEWFDHFDGIFSEFKAIEEIKKNTRHYAKRQLTWFKKQDGIHWIPPGVDIIAVVNDLLKLNT